MFTAGTFALTILIGWYVARKNDQDRATYDQTAHNDGTWLLLLHTRQDLKLIAFLLGAVVVMLGVVADRIG